jgi:hypothetical protein
VFRFSLQIVSEILRIPRRTERDMIMYKYIGRHVSAGYSCPILVKLKCFSTNFREKNKIPNFMNICLVGAELFHGDRLTDMTKLIVTF